MATREELLQAMWVIKNYCLTIYDCEGCQIEEECNKNFCKSDWDTPNNWDLKEGESNA